VKEALQGAAGTIGPEILAKRALVP
jgi:hypothetical protein